MRALGGLLAAAWLALAPGAALGEEAPAEEAPADEVPAEEAPEGEGVPAEEAPEEEAAAEEAPADEAPAVEVPPEAPVLLLPATTWPLDGRTSCPASRACCVEGEAACTHPGMSRLMQAGVSGGIAGVGMGMFLGLGDALNAGDPQGAMVGVGLIGLGGSLFGLLADLLTPGPAGSVADRPGRPTARISLSPGGSSTLDESSAYGLGIRVDPTVALGDHVTVQPHVGLSINLGNSVSLDPRPQSVAPRPGQDAGFPVALRTHRLRGSVGAELAVKLPYPLAVKRPLYSGAVELRYKPMWELRRRVLHPGEANVQVIEHSALYPLTLGMRWHVAPRQRFTFYFGPRIDWISFSDPGSTAMRRGGASLGSFYGEAWWQLDIPFSPLGRRKTSVNGRLNLGYTHSNLDGMRLDVGAIVGYFGPVELSFDLRVRKLGAPVAMQITAGYRLATGGGPFVELGIVAPDLGRKAGS